MQISHIEVRRHPIWQREVRHEHRVAGPTAAPSARTWVALVMLVGVLAIGAAILMRA